MIIRCLPIVAIALSLGATACTESEQRQVEQDAAAAGERIEQSAAELGERIEAGAADAARGVESAASDAAARLEDNQRQAAAEGRTGAVDPDTGQRVE